MEEQYKEYQIKYLEDQQIFTVNIGNSNYQNSDLSSVKKYIDRLDKKDFNRVDVIVEEYNEMADAIVTSYPDGQSKTYQECWVSFKNKSRHQSRSKIHTKNVFLDNPNNREILTQMKEKEESIKEITDDIRDLREKLEIYKPDE